MTDVFHEVADILFGGGADELVYKANPDGADVASRQKKQAQIGLATNIIGIAAGTAGTLEAGRKFAEVKNKGKRRGTPKYPGAKAVGRGVGKLKAISPKVAIPATAVAGAGLGLQAANIGGDLVANRVLSREAKKKVEKSASEIKENASFPTSKGQLTRASITTAAHAGGQGAEYVKTNKGQLKQIPNKVKTLKAKVQKNEIEVRWDGDISKVDEDKRQVFGWASVVELGGEPVVDLQGDYISIEEVEKSAYEYIQKSRKGGDMHLRDEWNEPKHSSDMIESFVVTPEKKKALGLPEDMPTGWWVGYQVNDPDLWAKVKSGERTGFSIHGRGVRT